MFPLCFWFDIVFERWGARALLLVGWFSLTAAAPELRASEAEEPSKSAQANFFESKIRPLLLDNCCKCHGAQKQEGGLRLDTREGFFKGGENGSLLSDSTQDSRLLSAIHYRDLEMPPSRKLSDDQIALLESWVSNGSYWPLSETTKVPAAEKAFTQADYEYWFFQPRKNMLILPDDKDDRTDPSHSHHPSRMIDHLIQKERVARGLNEAPRANALQLVRRVYLDLIGTPPTYAEAKAFVDDPSSQAYANLIDRLLDDPRYGERWARFWLDLVRFAESDGYKQDAFRPTAFRYRDYVIRSFNQDKPYSDFVREQIAGDELDPDSLEFRDAAGYLRLWAYEYNQRDVAGQWAAILNDLTDVTGEAFLGLGIGCARCHDHKFDPILQRDYYRLQAFFAAMIPREDLPASNAEQWIKYLADHERWLIDAQSHVDQIEEIEKPVREKTRRSAIEKFPPEIRPALYKEQHERSPYERQIAHLASLQQARDVRELKWEKVLAKDAYQKWQDARDALSKLPSEPKPPPMSMTATDVGPDASDLMIPGKSSFGPIRPGIPSILDPSDMAIVPRPEIRSTGRRTALANWIVRDDNPLTWRVITNRIWQHHFGSGLVANASDFGRLTQPPTHPDLLDYLSSTLVQNGGRIKALHRWILLSSTYQQSAYPQSLAAAAEIDADNLWLWRFAPRRLDAEQIRDSILFVTGEASHQGPDTFSNSKNTTRSIYVRAMRNSQDRFLAIFDAPDASSSTAKRIGTTTPLQSLMMMNSEWVLSRANLMAQNILREHESENESIEEAYRRTFLRMPTDSERNAARKFLGISSHTDASSTEWKNLFGDFCHVLINSNAFLYLE